MKLSELVGHNTNLNDTDPDISSIHYDSRNVIPGSLFIAITGLASDGNQFVESAIQNGAVAVISESSDFPDHIKEKTILVHTYNARKSLAEVSAAFYSLDSRLPSEDLIMIAVTGTNGKTTTTYILEKILAEAGFKTGVIGTINYRYSDKVFPNPRTTPESLDLQRILNEMLNHGVTHVIMEVSSHAIDLFRVWKCHFDIAAFTNLTQDHLDYHKDMEDYFNCKKRLFTEYLVSGPKKGRTSAVINCDDPKGSALAEETHVNLYKTGSSDTFNIYTKESRIGLDGIKANIQTNQGEMNIYSPLVGRFNLENILISIGVAESLKINQRVTEKALSEFSNTPGRMNSVKNTKKRFVFVDYAHTPDALENVLTTLTKLATGNIISVFGCGGDRDNSKRPMMGKIGYTYSDLSIITSDNPRTENPDLIIQDVVTGLPENAAKLDTNIDGQTETGKGYIIIQDRGLAIKEAIRISKPGDTILIAGKGHEDYQILGTDKIHFDDCEEAEKALRSL